MSRSHQYLYRSRKGVIFGLCRGLSNYTEIPVFWIRLGLILAGVFTSFLPVILIYIVASIFVKPEPLMPLNSDEDREFYHSYMDDRKMALRRIKRKFDGLERRVSRMETVVTDKEYDWERRLHRGV